MRKTCPLTTEMNAIDWASVERQATGILGRYIQIDTSNPPGNEDSAARFLSRILSDEDIQAEIYESTAGRANLVARLSSDGNAGPLLLLHHMDVVPATPSTWRVSPFDGVVRDGYVWGRGAIDDKGLGTMHLMAFVLLKRLRIPLKRDVILMAVSDEENGGKHGAEWMTDNRWPDIDCEYVWDEGGVGSQGIMGDRPVFAVAVSERRAMNVRLTARGTGGHGSLASDTPIDRLVKALTAIQKHRRDSQLNDVTREFFRRIADLQRFPMSWLVRNIGNPLVKPLMERRLSNIPAINAMLRDTMTATILSAGYKANVAPESAEAVLDARLLPDTDAGRFIYDLTRVINDDSISIEADRLPDTTPSSSTGTAMFEILERAIKEHVPDAIVTPYQSPAVTDSRFFRAKGANAYGLIPAILAPDEVSTIHGVDERLSVKNLTLGIKISFDALRELCVK